jgi:hypothetical protein
MLCLQGEPHFTLNGDKFYLGDNKLIEQKYIEESKKLLIENRSNEADRQDPE